ncbi:PREDICTED: putative RNA-binding protein Luc7-like 2 isoform X1 [Theobroma cacao]|uniref:RNA-binding protein Luc7-like 2 isoform X1 n=1 Tax=Theobroma cacao TaxID=3641 RepID=A0AB32WF27_THECC|nr:PREDICTED: putative RNA-binding protein Luc7-like 2 isoform X1 [Theobroma cacao]XP_017977525.1 PREDICTED: putative RNA-binding protein Luc7-like 2 isoform X1 [Theobroma cacao]
MDAMRKQLDVLMGANRNGDVREVNRKYYDRDVCRLFLSGLCPHELFQLTKMDMGPCPKVHSLQLRKEYEEAKAKGVDNYDRELEDAIDRLIVECDRKIGRALKRLEDEDAKAAIAISVSDVTQTPEVLELSKQIKEKLKEADQHDLEGKTDLKIRALEEVEELRTKRADKQSMLLLDAFNKDRASLPQPLPNPPALAPLPVPAPDPRTQEMINEKLKKAEDLGEKGMVDEAQKALEEAEALKKLPARQEPVLDSSKYTAADVRITDQKLRVCDICGAFLSVYDSDRRLADHFGGKLHLGYMQIRDKLAELQEERNKSRKLDRHDDRRSKEQSRDCDTESSRDHDRGDSRDRGRDYDRRSRDRDRYYDRDRGYDRDRERDYERSRSYDSRSRRRSRSRSKERSRDYDRHRRDRY